MKIEPGIWARIRWANVGRIAAVLAATAAMLAALTRGTDPPPVPSGRVGRPALSAPQRTPPQPPRPQTVRREGAARVAPGARRSRGRRPQRRKMHPRAHPATRLAPVTPRAAPASSAGAGPAEFVP